MVSLSRCETNDHISDVENLEYWTMFHIDLEEKGNDTWVANGHDSVGNVHGEKSQILVRSFTVVYGAVVLDRKFYTDG